MACARFRERLVSKSKPLRNRHAEMISPSQELCANTMLYELNYSLMMLSAALERAEEALADGRLELVESRLRLTAQALTESVAQ